MGYQILSRQNKIIYKLKLLLALKRAPKEWIGDGKGDALPDEDEEKYFKSMHHLST